MTGTEDMFSPFLCFTNRTGDGKVSIDALLMVITGKIFVCEHTYMINIYIYTRDVTMYRYLWYRPIFGVSISVSANFRPILYLFFLKYSSLTPKILYIHNFKAHTHTHKHTVRTMPDLHSNSHSFFLNIVVVVVA